LTTKFLSMLSPKMINHFLMPYERATKSNEDDSSLLTITHK
jgi:hypothetical protein